MIKRPSHEIPDSLDFFSRDANLDVIDPVKNRAVISRQVERIADTATNELERARLTLPTAAGASPGRLHVFAVGSAITDMAPKGVHARHNYRVFADQTDRRLNQNLEMLDASRQQVRSIWRGMYMPNHMQTPFSRPWSDKREDLDDSLISIFGLPVYRAILGAMGVNHLIVSGYGLAYGYYFAKYLNAPRAKRYCPDASGPFVFVSYSRKDTETVKAELELLEALGVRYWYDGDSSGRFTDQIAAKITSSTAVLAFLSKRSIHSKWVVREIDFSIEENKKIIPIVLDDVRLPAKIRARVAGIDRIYREKLDPDQYLAKLDRVLPKRARSPI